MSQSVYIAGPYERKAELKEVAKKLSMEYGFTITSRWLTDPTWPDEAIDPLDPNADSLLCHNLAIKDLEDVAKAQIFILFSDGNGRGGRNVEFGYALRCEKMRIFIVGKMTTIFHHIQYIPVFANTEDMYPWMRMLVED
jgi:hypothetical protein